MKKFLKVAALALLILAAAGSVGMWLFARSRHAEPAAEALAALRSDADVAVEQGRYLVFRPLRRPVRMGVVFYPGAGCDVRGYAQVLRRIAAEGYLVAEVSMPLEFAFLGPYRALDVPPAFPEIKRWAILGHSLGGAMAGQFVNDYPDVMSGLIIWDSFPPPNNRLASWGHPIWHIHRATLAGEPPEFFNENRGNYPADAHWVPIPGGIHMYYGAFVGGAYKEDWKPAISRAQQQDLAVAATLKALESMQPTS